MWHMSDASAPSTALHGEVLGYGRTRQPHPGHPRHSAPQRQLLLDLQVPGQRGREGEGERGREGDKRRVANVCAYVCGMNSKGGRAPMGWLRLRLRRW